MALSIIPGRVGELIKSQILKTKFGIPRSKTAPIIILEQLYTLIGLIIVSFFGIWLFELGAYVIGFFTAVLIFSSDKIIKRSLWFPSPQESFSTQSSIACRNVSSVKADKGYFFLGVLAERYP